MKNVNRLLKRKYFNWIKENLDFLVGFVFISTFIFAFLGFSGAITSGYNFIDDHEMLNIRKGLDNSSFLEIAIGSIRNDLNIRFRPLYYLHRVAEIKVLGINFFALSLYTGILASLSFSFVYFGARKIKFSISEALVLVALTFIGVQMAIWWRLGPAETLGAFFFSISFFFMGKCFKDENRLLNNILFVFFLTLSSLCKEIFVLSIPVFVLFKIWNEKNIFNITFKKSVKNNYLLIIPLAAMFVELVIIKFVVGTNKIGYAGVTSSTSEFILGIKNILFNKASLLPWLKFIGVLFILYVSSFIFIKNNKKENILESLKSLAVYFFFASLVVLPSIFMYAKSGMVERYLLPATFGLALLTIGILRNTKQFFFKIVMCGVIFIFLLTSFATARINAINFANEGKNTNTLLSSIKKYSNQDSKILLVADPVDRYEVSWSMKTYLSYYGLDNFYVYPMTREYKTDFERSLLAGWEKWFENKKLENIDGYPDSIIMVYKIEGEEEDFFSKSNLPKEYYKKITGEKDIHLLYVKK